MKPPIAALKRADRITEHVPKHALRSDELSDPPSIIGGAPMRRLPRQWRQQTRRAPEPTAQASGTSYHGRDPPRPVAEPMAAAPRKLASDDVQVRAPRTWDSTNKPAYRRGSAPGARPQPPSVRRRRSA